jgi:hypothetical protein
VKHKIVDIRDLHILKVTLGVGLKVVLKRVLGVNERWGSRFAAEIFQMGSGSGGGMMWRVR